MHWTLPFGIVCLALIIWEWRSGSHVARALTICIALFLLFSARPSPYRALRRAVGLQHVTQNLWIPEQKATEFQSGLFTMYRAMEDDTDMGTSERALSIGVIVWLALTPVFWRWRPRRVAGSAPASAAATSTSSRAA
jgi:hypothetical protein